MTTTFGLVAFFTACATLFVYLLTRKRKIHSPLETNESVKQKVDLIGTQDMEQGTTTKKFPFKMCTCLSLPHSTNF